jgi:hypothetical protein
MKQTDISDPCPSRAAPTPMSARWSKGYAAAEEQAQNRTGPIGLDTFVNPFAEGTEEHAGFEEGRHDFTRTRGRG